MAEGTSVGLITLDLRVVNNIGEQLQTIAGTVGRTAEQSFRPVGEAIGEAVSRPVENVRQATERTLGEARQQAEQTSEEIAEIARQAAQRYQDGLRRPEPVPQREPAPTGGARLASQMAPPQPPVRENPAQNSDPGFRAAADNAGLLQQRLDNINAQIGLQQQRLRELMAQYNQAAREEGPGSAAAQRLDSQITGIQGRLISLQQTANRTQEQIRADMERTGEAARRTSSRAEQNARNSLRRIRNSVGGTLSGLTKPFQKFARMIRSAFKRVFIMASMYAFFRAFKSLISSASAQSKEFSRALNQVKANLAIAFLPIMQAALPALTALMNGLAAATKAIATFISNLFGKTYAQTAAMAKQLQGLQAQAGKAKGALAGFDEINVLSAPEGEADGGIDYGALDTSESEGASKAAETVREAVRKMGETFRKYKAPITAAAAGIGTAFAAFKIGGFVKDLMGAEGALAGLKTAFAVLTSPAAIIAAAIGTVAAAIVYLYQTDEEARAKIQGGWENMKTVFSGMGSQIWQTLLTACQLLGNGLSAVWDSVILPIGSLIIDIFHGISQVLLDLWKKYGEETFGNIRGALEATADVVSSLWNSTLKPIADVLFETLTALWTDHLQPLAARVGEFVMTFVNGALEIYNQFIAPLVSWIVELLGPTIVKIVGTAIKLTGELLGFLADFAGKAVEFITYVTTTAQEVLGHLMDFIKGVFTGDWEMAFKGLGNFFISIINGMIGGFEKLLNWVIDGLNKIIEAYNDVVTEIPGLGKHMTLSTISRVSFGRIPELAAGGVITKPTLAMMGEYAGAGSDPEIVSPQSAMQETFMQSLSPLIGLLQTLVDITTEIRVRMDNGDIILQVDGKTFARLTGPYFEAESRRRGPKLVMGGV